jgi:hypothetical protein
LPERVGAEPGVALLSGRLPPREIASPSRNAPCVPPASVVERLGRHADPGWVA